MIVDIRDFNSIIQLNVYSVFSQADILTAVSDCSFILIIDWSDFFY